MQPIRHITAHKVHLMRILLELCSLRHIARRHHTHHTTQVGRHLTHILIGHAAYLSKRKVPLREKHNLVRMIHILEIRLKMLRLKFLERLLHPKNRITQGIATKEQGFEVIKNQFRWVIIIRLYLVQYHIQFLLYLLLRKHRIEHHIHHQPHDTFKVRTQHSSIQHCLLLRGISIHLAPHMLQLINNTLSRITLRTLV